MGEIKIPIPTQPDNIWILRHLVDIDSTNSYVSELAKKGLPEGQVILADHQSAGRGRLDRDWVDSPGSSVLMSILLRPNFPPQFFYLITSALSLAASQILESKFSIPCKLKWPNDVMVADKKIGGILAEAAYTGVENSWVVAGIGLNCLQSGDELAVISQGATSILAESGIRLDEQERIDLATQIVARFATFYVSLGDPDERTGLADLYRSACDTIGKLVRVEMPGETLTGIASGISEEGNLLIETDTGMRAVPAGDIIHLRKSF
ncbi:MAG: biotin--[acetyl-CoA-carboxylase] ligase [Actinomycetota bacterium]|nr:MAG: biotin--[acetyl-CoA-carboxylase] ligase [Actinomycetota bacterium]